MGHRQYFPPLQIPDMGCEDIWTHQYPEPHLCLGTAAVGVNPTPYFDITPRSNNLPSANAGLAISNYNGSINSGLHDPFPHPSSASSSNHSNHIVEGPSCYDGFAINSQMDFERAPYKRKAPVIPMGFDCGNNSSYQIAGNPASFSMSSVNSQPNPIPAPQHFAWDPTGMPLNFRNNNHIPVAEDSQRNVRSRQSLALYLGNNQTGVIGPNSHLPHPLFPSSSTSGQQIVAGQWGNTPASFGYNRRIVSSGVGNFNHEMNQSLGGSNSTNGNMEVDSGYNQSFLYNRNAPPFPTTHASLGTAVHSYDQRPLAQRAPSSYQHGGFIAPLPDSRQQGTDVVPPPRHARPQSTVSRGPERHGRSRGLYERFQSFSFEESALSGWLAEGRRFYGPRNLFDQHSDLRLDIDNMSYEELLALEERIGNVSTGLSVDSVSRCLMETPYSLPDQIQDNQEDTNCIICLEEYKEKENVGRLSCGHDFHSGCIKKWLSIKNVCPICKASALPDSSKEN